MDDSCPNTTRLIKKSVACPENVFWEKEAPGRKLPHVALPPMVCLLTRGFHCVAFTFMKASKPIGCITGFRSITGCAWEVLLMPQFWPPKSWWWGWVRPVLITVLPPPETAILSWVIGLRGRPNWQWRISGTVQFCVLLCDGRTLQCTVVSQVTSNLHARMKFILLWTSLCTHLLWREKLHCTVQSSRAGQFFFLLCEGTLQYCLF